MYFGNKSENSAKLSFVYVMIHLSVNHLASQIFNNSSERFDATAPFMVLVIKLSSFAWSCYDGSKSESDLSSSQKKNAVKEMPNLVEYFGFIFFFGGFLVGPMVHFKSYIDFIEQKGDFEKLPSIRHRIIPTVKCLLSAVLTFLIALKLDQIYDYPLMLNSDFLTSNNFVAKFKFMMICGLVARQKYYTAWKLSEGACNLAGIGFSGIDENGKAQYKRVRNIEIFAIEFPQNMKALTDSWNCLTALWLRNDVYMRLTKKGQKPGFLILVATFATSAFWHGFWPGYYFFFLSASLANISARWVRKNIRPFFLENKALKGFYDIVGIFSTVVTINYIAAPFQLLTTDKSLAFYSAMNWFLHIIIGTILVIDFFKLHTLIFKTPLKKKSDEAVVLKEKIN
ncbi:lysophospholipid acyltransferase [Clydaea vesicula]|uniref:Lysophospholipid acyltransferase n=1 Tax=Clydaea vesicula TaxID=447962 RepID=A0AAD5UBQ2_9FUNG|nr:lysophospholipid acyltransferase [Clydaea vesicula]